MTKRLTIVGAALLLLAAGCVYDVDEPREIPDFEDAEPISFSEDVIPIFEAGCLGGGCHDQGAVPPYLSAEVAYEDLFARDQINLEVPEESILYLRMIDKSRPMPPSGLLPQKDVMTVLGWISQGAEDN